MQKYTPELFDKICKDISESSKGLKHICDNHGISSSLFYSWLQGDEKTEEKLLLDKYARAREAQADFLADEIIEIADDGKKDTIIGDYGPYEDKEWTSRSKLRVEVRKWTAAKLKPKKYGDKLDLTSKDEKLPTGTVVVFKLPDNGRDKEE